MYDDKNMHVLCLRIKMKIRGQVLFYVRVCWEQYFNPTMEPALEIGAASYLPWKNTFNINLHMEITRIRAFFFLPDRNWIAMNICVKIDIDESFMVRHVRMMRSKSIGVRCSVLCWIWRESNSTLCGFVVRFQIGEMACSRKSVAALATDTEIIHNNRRIALTIAKSLVFYVT